MEPTILTGWEKIVFVIAAVLLVAVGVFRLDHFVVSKRKPAVRDPRAPRRRVYYQEVDSTHDDGDHSPKSPRP